MYAHIVWGTYGRQGLVRKADVPVIIAAAREAAARCEVNVHAAGILTDHVHLLVSFRPDQALSGFIRHAKSESSRRLNLEGRRLFRWQRGYWVESVSRSMVRAARVYIGNQFARHPERIPA
jgi:REP-associated tyrosine transposase